MQFPPLAHWQRYPVTTGIALGAVAMTAWSNFGEKADPRWFMSDAFWSGQLWQPLTSCLLHLSVMHLVFNLLWLWGLGAIIEREFGSARAISIAIFLAFGSSLAEYAFSAGSAGLSGVVYGLFGLLWVLSRKDRRFWGIIDQRTVHLMIGWFFFCIFCTYANIMAIGNVAHGSGAILGAVLGFAIVEKDKKRKIGYVSLLVLLMLAIFAASSVGRQYVNFSGDVERQEEMRAYELVRRGYEAHLAHNYEEAADLYSKGLAIDDSLAETWYNLGLCYIRLGKYEKARDAFQHAVLLKPDKSDFKNMLETTSPTVE